MFKKRMMKIGITLKTIYTDDKIKDNIMRELHDEGCQIDKIELKELGYMMIGDDIK